MVIPPNLFFLSVHSFDFLNGKLISAFELKCSDICSEFYFKNHLLYEFLYF